LFHPIPGVGGEFPDLLQNVAGVFKKGKELGVKPDRMLMFKTGDWE